MDKNIIKNLKQMDDLSYYNFMISYICAPTIFGHKAASLLNFNSYGRNFNLIWRNEVHKESCLDFVELARKESYSVVLFYNRCLLEKLLMSEKSCEFLGLIGYDVSKDTDSMLDQLKQRFNSGCPHEVGVFLDFPLDDVKGFIVNKGGNYIYNGYWKVYGSLNEALRKFEMFDNDKRVISNMKGIS